MALGALATAGLVALPLLGIGDVVLTALYLAAARHLGLGVRKTVAAFALAYALTFGAVALLGQALPALPLLAVAFVAVHPAVWRLRPEDRRPALVGVVITTAVFVALAFK